MYVCILLHPLAHMYLLFTYLSSAAHTLLPLPQLSSIMTGPKLKPFSGDIIAQDLFVSMAYILWLGLESACMAI